jgi:outer membrane protein assembly factor BamD (BamD/ComL family)
MNIDDLSYADVLFDAGFTGSFFEIVKLGASIQNVDTSFTPGYNVRAGLGINVLKMDSAQVTLEFDAKYNSLDGSLRGFMDGLSYAAGLEATVFKVLSIRGGYSIRNENQNLGGISGLSIGAGVTLEKISFDYAFTSRGDLGMTHLAGIKFIYEGSEEKEKKNYQKLTEFLAYQSFKDGEEAFDAGNYKRALAYWEEVKSMMPEYEGLEDAMAKAKGLIASGGSIEKIEKIFKEGMKAYENFDFDKAVSKWNEVKRIYPQYKDIDVWLGDAKELKASRGMSKQAEKYFREGIKFYNNCDYDRAITSWEKGLAKDPKNKKIEQYIDRTRAKRLEIREGISKAKADVSNDSTVIEGIKRLRSISNVCPAYQDAADILSTLKGMIAVKTRDYYFKGIEKYTEGNLDAAIIYWTNIEALDPKSEYLVKVKRYITDARNKQKAIQGFEKKKKK